MAKKKPTRSSETTSRKQQHVELVLQKNVRFKQKTTGFERFSFVHNALPELSLSEIDTSVEFLHKRLRLPLIVSSMTGGYKGAEAINRDLATVCAEKGLAMGVGSQRQALENDRFHSTYRVVREAAPEIPVIANIGAAQVALLRSADEVKPLLEMVRADALAVHLNPLQELLQPEGQPDFRGVLQGIGMLTKALAVPVIVKEIGTGISQQVARRLFDAGVRYIDVAGAGGTSWAGVEALRSHERPFAERFWDWGIPTADALRAVSALRKEGHVLTIIGSGGVESGRDVALCIALGADVAASARPLLQSLSRGGIASLRSTIAAWEKELRSIMFLTGSRTLRDLQAAPLREEAS
jgi:isopentenyl-diphosphate delta-isomerase